MPVPESTSSTAAAPSASAAASSASTGDPIHALALHEQRARDALARLTPVADDLCAALLLSFVGTLLLLWGYHDAVTIPRPDAANNFGVGLFFFTLAWIGAAGFFFRAMIRLGRSR